MLAAGRYQLISLIIVNYSGENAKR